MTQIENNPEYYITEEGEVYSMINNAGNLRKEPYLLKKTLGRDGYYWVGLKGSNKRMMKVHRLVALTFIPNPGNFPVVNHKNGNKQDNTTSNLEWCTYSENSIHALATGLTKPRRGEDHGSAKLTDLETKQLIELSLEGYTNEELGTLFSLHPRYISLVRNKKRQLHIWELHFKGVTPVGSNKLEKGRDLAVVEEIVAKVFTTKDSNAQIARDYSIDPSTVSRIRSNHDRVQAYYKPFIKKYLN